MPDSLLSSEEGSDPYEGQDLDGLLSGENCYVPDGLRRVVPALDALRAAPMRAELSAEAAARAYFRKIAGSGDRELGRLNAPADDARVVIAPSAGGERHLARRPHRHRRSRQRGRWSAKAIAGGAVGVVVIAVVAAFAGTRSASDGHHSALTLSAGAESARAKPAPPGANSVDGSASPAPTTKPTTGTAPQSGDELCRQYFADVTQRGQAERDVTEQELYKRLSTLAGGPGDVGYYCTHALQPWAESPVPGRYLGVPGYPLPSQSQGSQGSQGVPGSQGSQGNGGNGGSGSGNGNGGSGNGNGGSGNVSNQGTSDSSFRSQNSQ